MSKSKEIELVVEEVSPELAEEWLKKNTKNRRLSKGDVKKLVDAMESGDWGLSTDAIGFDTRGKLVNGQHRLHAVVAYGKPVKFLVARGLPPKVFQYLDTGRKRNGTDVFSIEANEHPDVLAMSARLLIGRMNGQGILSGSVSNARLIKLVHQYSGIVDSVNAIVQVNQDSDGFLRQLMNLGIAACFHFIANSAGISGVEKFFSDLANLESGEKNSPTTKLRNLLLKNKKAEQKLSREAIHGCIVKAILAWSNGEDIQTLNCQKGEYPVLGGLDLDPEAESEDSEEGSEEKPTPRKRRATIEIDLEEPDESVILSGDEDSAA